MKKELEQIQKHSKEILGDYPEKREELITRLAENDEKITQAKAAVEAAEDLKGYDKATEVLKRAELERKFTRNALEKLDAAPRMAEDEYFQALNTCKNIMDAAAVTYRSEAAGLMAQLKAIRDAYQETAAEVNSTLEALDAAANVLQSKYPCKVTTYTNGPERSKRDPGAWRQYALRYDAATAATLATECDPEYKDKVTTHDSVLTAAWGAIERAFPRKIY